MKYLKDALFADITTIPLILQGSYYPALTGLRGVAILMVLFSHFGLNNILYPFHIYIDSDTGVNIFFVLSGFLITTLLIKEKVKTGKISLKQFYIRRALRILPVAYLFLVLLMVLNYFLHLKISCLDLLASFLFFKNMPLKNEPYTAHFWTLAVEVQFYLIFPYLLTLNLKRYFIIALSIIIMVPLISVFGYYHAPFLYRVPLIASITKVAMYCFWKGPVIILIGSVFSILVFKGMMKGIKFSPNYFLSFILLLAAIIINTRTFVFYDKYLSAYLMALLTGFAVVLSLNPKNFLSAIVNSAFLTWIGIISYSLYIWQELFIGLRAWQPWMHAFNHCPLYVLIILKLVTVFVIAATSYYFFEKRFLKLKSRKSLTSE